jgi:hypothetical protein
VDHWIDWLKSDPLKDLQGEVSDTYMETTIMPICQNMESEGCSIFDPKTDSLRMYFGATFDDPVDGMFSFFPAQVGIEGQTGFPRPILDFPEVISKGKAVRYRLNRRREIEDIHPLWSQVANKVTRLGLVLGLGAEIPKRME